MIAGARFQFSNILGQLIAGAGCEGGEDGVGSPDSITHERILSANAVIFDANFRAADDLRHLLARGEGVGHWGCSG